MTPLTTDDEDKLYPLFSSRETMKYITPHPVRSKSEMRKTVERYLKPAQLCWIITKRDTEEFAGFFRFHKIHEFHRKAEMNAVISDKFQQTGVMSELMPELLAFAFNQLKLNRLVGDIFEENEGSRKLLEKFGFHLDGVLRHTDFDGERYHNTAVYSLLKEEYSARRTEEPFIYLVRHCETTGQKPDAPLTDQGALDAVKLGEFFKSRSIQRVITSPYKRAVDSIRPAASHIGFAIEKDDRLMERKLSGKNLDDWETWIRRSFDDPDLCLEGGESGNEAARRANEVIDELLSEGRGPTVVVTHGNLLSFLLRKWMPEFGYNDWKNLRNPDIFALRVSAGKVTADRLKWS
jgi:[ribosomal protein S5]-alanine N-acetyltransferase